MLAAAGLDSATGRARQCAPVLVGGAGEAGCCDRLLCLACNLPVLTIDHQQVFSSYDLF